MERSMKMDLAKFLPHRINILEILAELVVVKELEIEILIAQYVICKNSNLILANVHLLESNTGGNE